MRGRGQARAFTELLGRSSDAIFVVAAGFHIVWWGPRAERELGIPASRALGRRCFDLFVGSQALGRDLCGPDCWVWQALQRGHTVPAFCLELCVGGAERRPFTLGFLADESGEFVAHILREREPAPRLKAVLDRSAELQLADLTPRQRQVLELIMAGASSRELARRLCVTHATARNHVQNVLNKLGVHSRLEAALVGQRTGLPQQTQTN